MPALRRKTEQTARGRNEPGEIWAWNKHRIDRACKEGIPSLVSGDRRRSTFLRIGMGELKVVEVLCCQKMIFFKEIQTMQLCVFYVEN